MVDTRAAPELPPGLDDWPPTQDDLPYSDGEPLESNLHAINLRLLVNTLRPYLDARRPAFIGDNMFVYFSPDQEKTHHFRGPDFFVVLDVPPGPRKSWVVWQEDLRVPDIVIELMSDSTARMDRNEKREIYQNRLRVPEYFLFHPWTAEFAGYQLVDWVYQPIAADNSGGLLSTKLDLKLVVWEGEIEGVHSRWLRWATLDGALLPTREEDTAVHREQVVEERRLRAAADARAAEEQRRREAEAQRAEAADARAEEERRLREVERQRADALQAELERLRAQLGGPSAGA